MVIVESIEPYSENPLKMHTIIDKENKDIHYFCMPIIMHKSHYNALLDNDNIEKQELTLSNEVSEECLEHGIELSEDQLMAIVLYNKNSDTDIEMELFGHSLQSILNISQSKESTNKNSDGSYNFLSSKSKYQIGWIQTYILAYTMLFEKFPQLKNMKLKISIDRVIDSGLSLSFNDDENDESKSFHYLTMVLKIYDEDFYQYDMINRIINTIVCNVQFCIINKCISLHDIIYDEDFYAYTISSIIEESIEERYENGELTNNQYNIEIYKRRIREILSLGFIAAVNSFKLQYLGNSDDEDEENRFTGYISSALLYTDTSAILPDSILLELFKSNILEKSDVNMLFSISKELDLYPDNNIYLKYFINHNEMVKNGNKLYTLDKNGDKQYRIMTDLTMLHDLYMQDPDTIDLFLCKKYSSSISTLYSDIYRAKVTKSIVFNTKEAKEKLQDKIKSIAKSNFEDKPIILYTTDKNLINQILESKRNNTALDIMNSIITEYESKYTDAIKRSIR